MKTATQIIKTSRTVEKAMDRLFSAALAWDCTDKASYIAGIRYLVTARADELPVSTYCWARDFLGRQGG